MAGQIGDFQIEIEQLQDYEFRVRLDKPQFPEMTLDAPGPVGREAVPSPSRILAAAVGHCLASGFLFCARKARLETGPIRATVHTELVRNDRNLPRVGKVEVNLKVPVAPDCAETAARVRAAFEDYCMVSQSVREGVPITVNVDMSA